MQLKSTHQLHSTGNPDVSDNSKYIQIKLNQSRQLASYVAFINFNIKDFVN